MRLLRGCDLLHNVVAEGWARLRERLAEAARSLPQHVIAEVEGYLKCKIGSRRPRARVRLAHLRALLGAQAGPILM